MSAQSAVADQPGTAKPRPFTPAELGLPGMSWDADVCRLQFMQSPDGWQDRCWCAVQVGCLILAAGWGRTLLEHRWAPAEAFGLDPAEPMNRDRWGAGLLVGWSDVVAMTAELVRMVAADGVGRKYWRRPLPLSVPVWDAVRWSA